jgi:hypothetical protein
MLQRKSNGDALTKNEGAARAPSMEQLLNGVQKVTFMPKFSCRISGTAVERRLKWTPSALSA